MQSLDPLGSIVRVPQFQQPDQMIFQHLMMGQAEQYPVTSIAGLADERPGEGLAWTGVRAADAAIRACAGRGLWAAAVDPHAATAPIPTATMASEAIRAFSRACAIHADLGQVSPIQQPGRGQPAPNRPIAQ